MRSLQSNLKTRTKKAGRYVANRKKVISSENKAKRVQYAQYCSHKPQFGFWDCVYFTDEAHYNATNFYQAPRVLREQGTRQDPENTVEINPQSSKWALHLYAWVNWYRKGPLCFYADDEDDNNLIPTPKPPNKPRRRKDETDESLSHRVRMWEANRPPEVTLEIQGSHLTQAYYTKHLLPTYIEGVHEARRDLSNQAWILQEDNDGSHGTRSATNVVRTEKDRNWIDTIPHPPQSPDLNPIEGCWNVLLQRTELRVLHGYRKDESGELVNSTWDGTLKHLKQILREEWDGIDQGTIQRRIIEMPYRCREMIRTGGSLCKTSVW